ncbi:hypothetical protein HDU85_005724 [Gaertneriomyces sp. JEL0708]|nr:hypothetical protein HDU85_005724 [Gaertneriomyces sp. JEL0708]
MSVVPPTVPSVISPAEPSVLPSATPARPSSPLRPPVTPSATPTPSPVSTISISPIPPPTASVVTPDPTPSPSTDAQPQSGSSSNIVLVSVLVGALIVVVVVGCMVFAACAGRRKRKQGLKPRRDVEKGRKGYGHDEDDDDDDGDPWAEMDVGFVKGGKSDKYGYSSKKEGRESTGATMLDDGYNDHEETDWDPLESSTESQSQNQKSDRYREREREYGRMKKWDTNEEGGHHTYQGSGRDGVRKSTSLTALHDAYGAKSGNSKGPSARTQESRYPSVLDTRSTRKSSSGYEKDQEHQARHSMKPRNSGKYDPEGGHMFSKQNEKEVDKRYPSILDTRLRLSAIPPNDVSVPPPQPSATQSKLHRKSSHRSVLSESVSGERRDRRPSLLDLRTRRSGTSETSIQSVIIGHEEEDARERGYPYPSVLDMRETKEMDQHEREADSGRSRHGNRRDQRYPSMLDLRDTSKGNGRGLESEARERNEAEQRGGQAENRKNKRFPSVLDLRADQVQSGDQAEKNKSHDEDGDISLFKADRGSEVEPIRQRNGQSRERKDNRYPSLLDLRSTNDVENHNEGNKYSSDIPPSVNKYGRGEKQAPSTTYGGVRSKYPSVLDLRTTTSNYIGNRDDNVAKPPVAVSMLPDTTKKNSNKYSSANSFNPPNSKTSTITSTPSDTCEENEDTIVEAEAEPVAPIAGTDGRPEKSGKPDRSTHVSLQYYAHNYTKPTDKTQSGTVKPSYERENQRDPPREVTPPGPNDQRLSDHGTIDRLLSTYAKSMRGSGFSYYTANNSPDTSPPVAMPPIEKTHLGSLDLSKTKAKSAMKKKDSNVDEAYISGPPPTSGTTPIDDRNDVCESGGTKSAPEYRVVKEYTATAKYAHRPVYDDEIAVKRGDAVKVAKVFRDGWAHGMNTRTGQQGMFPLTVVGNVNV